MFFGDFWQRNLLPLELVRAIVQELQLPGAEEVVADYHLAFWRRAEAIIYTWTKRGLLIRPCKRPPRSVVERLLGGDVVHIITSGAKVSDLSGVILVPQAVLQKVLTDAPDVSDHFCDAPGGGARLAGGAARGSAGTSTS